MNKLSNLGCVKNRQSENNGIPMFEHCYGTESLLKSYKSNGSWKNWYAARARKE